MTWLAGSDGRQYLTEAELARGGEGIILTVAARADLVVKRYLPGRATAEREHKLRAMIADPPRDEMREHFQHASITWPLALVAEAGRFAGYLMPRIDGACSLLNAYNPGAKHALGLDWHAQHQVAIAQVVTTKLCLRDVDIVLADLVIRAQETDTFRHDLQDAAAQLDALLFSLHTTPVL